MIAAAGKWHKRHKELNQRWYQPNTGQVLTDMSAPHAARELPGQENPAVLPMATTSRNFSVSPKRPSAGPI